MQERFFVRLRELMGAAALLGMGCDGIATVEVERTSMGVMFADEEPGDLDFGEFDNEENITEDDIASAHLTSVVIDVLEPEGGDLSFADRIELYIDAPGLPRRLLASQDRFPVGESRIVLQSAGLELEPYMIADSLQLTAVIDGEAPDEDVLVRAKARLDVAVTAAGVCNAM